VQVGHPYSKSEWYQSVFKKKKKWKPMGKEVQISHLCK
jgi:hypothetical protein